MKVVRKNASQVTSILGLSVFLISISFALMMALPFQPYQYLAFPEITEEVCTNGAVTVRADREIDTPALGSLDRAKVVSTWVNADNGAQIAAGEASIPVEDTDLQRLTSPIVRQAPGTPGTYYLYSETTVYGSLGLVPRHTTIATTSDYPVEVVDC